MFAQERALRAPRSSVMPWAPPLVGSPNLPFGARFNLTVAQTGAVADVVWTVSRTGTTPLPPPPAAVRVPHIHPSYPVTFVCCRFSC